MFLIIFEKEKEDNKKRVGWIRGWVLLSRYISFLCVSRVCEYRSDATFIFVYMITAPTFFFYSTSPPIAPLPPHENLCVCDRVVVVGLFWARQSLLHHDLFDLYWLKQQEIKNKKRKKGWNKLTFYLFPPSSRFVFLESKSQSSQPHD